MIHDTPPATYPVVTICGSMRFYDEMLEAARLMSLRGNIVLMPFVYFRTPEGQSSADKAMLDDMHFAKIRMSESIVVISPGGYVGESTPNEIRYAEFLGKSVIYWESRLGTTL